MWVVPACTFASAVVGLHKSTFLHILYVYSY